jgi:carbon storage regulator
VGGLDVMLVLARKIGQKIFIGDDIEITVVSVTARGEVRLGIEAPSNLLILREELKEDGYEG